MSSRNADSVVVPACDDTEEVSTFKYGNSAGSCRHELGVVSHDSSGVDDKVCALDVLGALPYENGDTHFSYGVESLCLVIVRACQVIALRVEYLCEGVHTRTADADEVNVLFSF